MVAQNALETPKYIAGRSSDASIRVFNQIDSRFLTVQNPPTLRVVLEAGFVNDESWHVGSNSLFFQEPFRSSRVLHWRDARWAALTITACHRLAAPNSNSDSY